MPETLVKLYRPLCVYVCIYMYMYMYIYICIDIDIGAELWQSIHGYILVSDLIGCSRNIYSGVPDTHTHWVSGETPRALRSKPQALTRRL